MLRWLLRRSSPRVAAKEYPDAQRRELLGTFEAIHAAAPKSSPAVVAIERRVAAVPTDDGWCEWILSGTGYVRLPDGREFEYETAAVPNSFYHAIEKAISQWITDRGSRH